MKTLKVLILSPVFALQTIALPDPSFLLEQFPTPSIHDGCAAMILKDGLFEDWNIALSTGEKVTINSWQCASENQMRTFNAVLPTP